MLKRQSYNNHALTVPNSLQTSFRSNFLRLSKFGNGLDPISALVAFVLSYSQIFFINTGLARQYIPDDQQGLSLWIKTIEDFFMLNDLLTFEPNDTFKFAVLAVIITYLSIIVISLTLVIYKAFNKDSSVCWYSRIWSYTIKIHPLVIVLPINNFCCQIKLLPGKELSTTNIGLFYASIFIQIINIVFAVVPYIFLFNCLPRKDIMSRKNSDLDLLTLSQKLIIPLTAKLLPLNTGTMWLVSCLNSLISNGRLVWFCYTLPRYHLKLLFLDFILIGAVTVAANTIIVTLLFNAILDEQTTFSSFCTLMLVFIALSFFCFFSLFKKTVRKVLFTPYKELSAFQAIHKLSILKFLTKQMKEPNIYQRRFDVCYFYFSVISNFSLNLFGEANNNLTGKDLMDRQILNQVKRNFLEEIAEHFNTSDFIKLLLAYFYAKTLKLYPLAIRTLAQVKCRHKKFGSSVDLLYSLIQDQILVDTKKEGLNVYAYIKAIGYRKCLQMQIQTQLEIQKNFWKEYSHSTPDVSKLQKLSHDINKQKDLIDRKWNQLQSKSDENFYLFFRLFGYYKIVVNDTPLVGEEYLSKYNLFQGRDAKAFNKASSSLSALTRCNYFHVTICTSSNRLGIIQSCSNQVEELLGYEREAIIGSNIGLMMTPYIANKHNSFLQKYIATGQSTLLGKSTDIFVKNRKGFLQKATVLADVHPFIQHEIFLTGIIQLVEDQRDYLFLCPNGEIDSCTEAIALKLGIRTHRMHISAICPDYAKFLDTFNYYGQKMVAKDPTENANFGTEPLTDNITFAESNFIAEDQTTTRRSLLQQRNNYGRFQREDEVDNVGMPFRTPEEREKIYKKYSVAGGKVKFNCSPSNTVSTDTFSSLCRVSINKLQDNYMIVLEVRKYNEFKEDLKFQRTSKFKPTEINEFEDKNKQDKDDMDVTLVEVDEKTDGWFDVAKMHLKDDPEIETPVTENITENFTERTTENIRETRKRRRTLRYKTIAISNLAIQKHISNTSTARETQDRLIPAKFTRMPSINRTISDDTISNKEKRVSAAISEALNTRFYSKPIYTYLLFMTMMMVCIFLMQFSLYIPAAQKVDRLTILASILDNSNIRTDTLVYLARGATIGRLAASNLISPDSTPSIATTIKNFLNGYEQELPTLKRSNQNLQLSIQDIEAGFRESFSGNHIRMYDIDENATLGSYELLNTFSATNLVVEKLLHFRQDYYDENQYNIEDADYIIVNVANDLMLGNINAVDAISKNVELSISQILEHINAAYGWLLGFFAFAYIASGHFIYRIYKTEVKLFDQFLGMKPKDVQLIQNKLNNFEKILKKEDCRQFAIHFSNPEIARNDIENSSASNFKAKQYKFMNKKRLQHHSWFKVTLLFFFTALLLGETIYSLSRIKGTIHLVGQKIQKLNKIQSLQYWTSSLFITLGLMYTRGDQFPVRGTPIQEEFPSELETIFSSINIILNMFKENESGVDSEIWDILTDDICSYVSPTIKPVCLNMTQDSEQLGLLTAISLLYSKTSTVFESYETSNRSLSAVQSITVNGVTTITPLSLMIRGVLFEIIDKIRTDVFSTLSYLGAEIIITLTLNLIYLVIVNLIIWSFVLKYYLELYNRFRRMMKIMPSNLLLKNPSLKGILMKTSGTKLDRIKNDL